MPHPTAGLLDDLRHRRAGCAVLGLGYVGLPLARALARRFRVVGIDISQRRLRELAPGGPAHHEWEGVPVETTADAAAVAGCRLVVISVPTPVDSAMNPDLGPLLGACRDIAPHLRRGTLVVFESTVYPGCTEEDCIPVLEQASGLKAGIDFAVGYSPERINPGDTEHTIERVVKVVSGLDAESCDCLAAVYGEALPAGVFRAPTLKAAEAAKVIENTQRDLNIALMNELALIFHRLGIDTHDVLATAGTKWNFLPFKPGLVGGHCIGVDPYYLTHRAQQAGYLPQVILAGRRINDGMGRWVARECVRQLCRRGCAVAGARVLILGGAFKEDVGDLRNSRVTDIVSELVDYGATPLVCEPLADDADVVHEIGGTPVPLAAVEDGSLGPVAAVILAVAHAPFRRLGPAGLKTLVSDGPVLDVKGVIDRTVARAEGLDLWRL